MKIGIICWKANAATVKHLAARILHAGAGDEVAILQVRRSPVRVAREALDKHGVAGVLRHALALVAPGGSSRASAEGAALARELRLSAEAHGLAGAADRVRVFTFRDLNAPGAARRVRGLRLDLALNAGGGLFRRPLLDAIPGGIWNPHMGALPEYRGMNALEWMAFHGQRPRITVHRIDAGIDTGGVIGQWEVPVAAGDTVASLRARAIVVGLEAMAVSLEAARRGALVLRPQVAGEGRQYYVMHDRLRAATEARLPSLCGNSP